MPVFHLAGGRILDPANRRDEVADLWLVDGKIATRPPDRPADTVLNLSGMIVLPGLVDMHVHLREPGREDEETIGSGTRAAAAGGVTSLCAMPNTTPPIDSQTGVKFILSRAQSDAVVNVYPLAAITRGQQGKDLTEFGDLLLAGAVGFSDEPHSVMNNLIMHRALDYARTFDTLILDHCEDVNLAEHGVMRAGELATRLGLQGWPPVAESIQTARDIDLAEYTGGRIHIQHVSTAASINFIRRARERGVNISAEATPHHLTLTVDALANYGTNFRCTPPLGDERDRSELVDAVRDGTIDVIVSDHEPHTDIEKDEMFSDAPSGVIGMETTLAVLHTHLVGPGILELPTIIEKMTFNPARLLDLHKGTLTDGVEGDVTVFDPHQTWTVDARAFQSKSANCPWNGEKLSGRVIATFVDGRMIYQNGRMLI